MVRSDKNYKSRLIEWSQKQHREVSFVVLSEEQRADGTFFVSEVLIDDEPYGRGEGFSKRESQQNAARVAIDRIG